MSVNWVITSGNELLPSRCQAIGWINYGYCELNLYINKLQRNSNQNTKSAIHENAFENFVRETAAILSGMGGVEVGLGGGGGGGGGGVGGGGGGGWGGEYTHTEVIHYCNFNQDAYIPIKKYHKVPHGVQFKASAFYVNQESLYRFLWLMPLHFQNPWNYFISFMMLYHPTDLY